jgi:hypothetical protein
MFDHINLYTADSLVFNYPLGDSGTVFFSSTRADRVALGILENLH